MTRTDTTWKDVVRVGLALGTPVAAVGLTAPLLVASTPGGQLPTLTQWAGFVGVLLAIMLAAGAVIPRIGGQQ